MLAFVNRGLLGSRGCRVVSMWFPCGFVVTAFPPCLGVGAPTSPLVLLVGVVLHMTGDTMLGVLLFGTLVILPGLAGIVVVEGRNTR